MKINVLINGEKKIFEIQPNEMLADVLRRNGYYGVKIGCREGDCGVCNVILNGKVVNSCITFAAKADNSEVMTIEGLGSPAKPHPLQKAYAETGAVQCGFCTPGSILAANQLLEKNPTPTDEEIKLALDGNYCRCTGYVKKIEAVQKAAKVMNKKSKKAVSTKKTSTKETSKKKVSKK